MGPTLVLNIKLNCLGSVKQPVAPQFGHFIVFQSIDWKTIKCPNCGATGCFTEPRQFNLMFKTNVGPIAESGTEAYLRPETAQGIYVNYLNVQGAMRLKIPFGIAQIGKAFRLSLIHI